MFQFFLVGEHGRDDFSLLMQTVAIPSGLKYQPPPCYIGAARLRAESDLWWRGPHAGGVTDVHLVRAGRKGLDEGLVASLCKYL